MWSFVLPGVIPVGCGAFATGKLYTILMVSAVVCLLKKDMKYGVSKVSEQVLLFPVRHLLKNGSYVCQMVWSKVTHTL